MGRFDGKVVLITGGARGQGRSHALAFAREGADIAFCDISEQLGTVPYPTSRQADLDETVKLVEELDRRCVAVRADVRDRDQVQDVADRTRAELGRIDVLLANAGIFSFGTVAEMSEDMWQEMIAVNLTGVFHAFRAVLPTMIDQGYGRIVATSSMAGKMGQANIAHYVAAKWGVIGLVKSTAIEVAGNGVTVNAVCPTGVDTDMIQNSAAYELFLPGTANPTRDDAAPAFQSLNHVPIPWVEPVDISNTMLFLASEEARYVTGESVAVAAGMNANNAA
ncbi:MULTISPECIES: mycofactocin-coupled SDR family oxidoreductase [unclassified Pseudonocardia]|uniref:mycofactocin-coupled SDR family oxidoreductase n=1 Tax=unclassified Pseudonocardia TaxID=2619320 RepID=UPI0001FFE44A|nr:MULTISPECIES: mycofactocin-coupled SDR family oxidoreductase [unclassified Pseudonocardia]ALE73902.1 3-ketoacyl-ACP reductase [Pseudonocardia sp. EC080625-04]ALL77293.1 3-ketoacyl-ACP reductase [Pseudonocardia sp. EC080610-09]ALL80209.1 3-ketoacyl-ACP reductase [Pseudonocardia sp. EC080619-01]OLM18098.1 3-oxoacyl-[acyl-carrier protein] reductase [Pseudonocardia sp. Ae707_Ps1]